MIKRTWQNEYKAPNDLNLICDSIYEFAILHKLLQLNSGCEKIHPTVETLRLGYMSKKWAEKAIAGLIDKKFVSKVSHTDKNKHLANEYIIDGEAIEYAIYIKTHDDKPKKVKTTKQRREIQRTYNNLYPDGAREDLANGFQDTIVTKQGEIITHQVTDTQRLINQIRIGDTNG